jgi:hypothetical protein
MGKDGVPYEEANLLLDFDFSSPFVRENSALLMNKLHEIQTWPAV